MELKSLLTLNLGYKLTDNLKFTIGGNNIFNEYPYQQNDGKTKSEGY